MVSKMYALALASTVLVSGVATTAHAQSETPKQLTDSEQSALKEVSDLLSTNVASEPQEDLVKIAEILTKFGIDTSDLTILLAKGGDSYFFDTLFEVVHEKYTDLELSDLKGVGAILSSISYEVNEQGESVLNGVTDEVTTEESVQELIKDTYFEVVQQDGKITFTSTLTESQLNTIDGVVIGNGGVFLRVDGTDYLHTAVANLRIPQNAVATRINGSKVVMHYTEPTDIVITSKNLDNVVIGSAKTLPFEDVPTDAWYISHLSEMFNVGLVSGADPTHFSPDRYVTRAQFSAILARALEIKAEGDFKYYDDIVGTWYEKDVIALAERDLLGGIEGKGMLFDFEGNLPISRQQAVVQLVDTLNYLGVATYADTRGLSKSFTDANKVDVYAKESVAYLVKAGILVSGENVVLNPNKPMTRAQMTKLVMETLKISDKY